ncbi:hypothetical protein R2G56_08255 [Nitratireductor aquimarinus]|uniref:Phage tail protein n=1 Tax=Nitratireductor aquimarinus TaxID=889300 RepID=A0ABU4AJ53_9HYPH|nr:hypothetical protein [Nitratireductor aquimarinus]MDV6226275.1 hypothetical protein [Nitratireductor aquimarinus]
MAGNLYEQGYYETGTASITQGQTVVTGQGTAWSQIVRPADDFGKHVGRPIPIASVDSDTQITLTYPWPGPTQAAAPYRVTFTPYHVAYRQALQEIGQLLSSGNVLALAGLVGAANQVPMFTGPGVLDLVKLAAGAFRDVTVSPDDDTAGRLLKVGDNINFYRLRDYGRYFEASANKNVDDAPVGEVALYNSLNPGTWPSPSGAVFFWVTTQRLYGNSAKLQKAVEYFGGSTVNEPREWFRVASGDGVYGPWRSSTPIRGSNANGSFIRFADGTQICISPSLTLNYANSTEINTNWTLPASLVSSDGAFGNVVRSRSAGDYSGVGFNQVGGPAVSIGTTSATLALFNPTGSPWNSGAFISNCRAFAIGRWF